MVEVFVQEFSSMRSSISIFTAGSWISSSFSRWLLGQYATLIFLWAHTSILLVARFVGPPQSPHSVSPLNRWGWSCSWGSRICPSGEPESLSPGAALRPPALEHFWALFQTSRETMGSWASSFVAISS